MSDVVVFDIAQARETAQTLRNSAEQIRDEQSRLQAASDDATSQWRGHSQQIFLELWGELRREFDQLSSELDELSDRLRRKADEIEAAAESLG